MQHHEVDESWVPSTTLPAMQHPSEQDLINYARDEVGRYKKFRILEHCKECPECADKLIAAARDHGPEPEPFRLSTWNKVSLVIMVLALLGVVFGLYWMVRQLGQDTAALYEEPPPGVGQPLDPESSRDPGSDRG